MGTETTKYRLVLDDDLSAGLRKAVSHADDLEDSMEGINKTTKKTGMSLKSAFGGLAIGAAFAYVGKEVIRLGMNMEQTRVSFETFLGSKSAANKVIDELNEFSNVTPFTNDQVIRAGKQLLAFGLEAEKLKGTLRSIGDISAGTGKDFNELSAIYGKAMTQGRIQGEELNQLSEAGIPIIKEFAKMFGVAEQDIKKMGSEGKISFTDLETAFQNMSSEGGMFFNLMEKQSKTFGGKLSTLVGKLQLLGASIGEGMTDGLGEMTQGLIDFVDNQTPNILTAIDTIKIGFSGLGDTMGQIGDTLSPGGTFWEDVLGGVTFIVSAIGSVLTFAMEGINALLVTAKGVLTYIAGAMTFDTATAEKGLSDITRGGTLGGEAVDNLGSKLMESLISSFKIGSDPMKKAASGASSTDTTTTTTTGGGLGSAKRNKLNGDLAGTQSKVKNITINIEKMVENISFNNITGKQSESELVEMIKRSLLTAVNDVNVIAR